MKTFNSKEYDDALKKKGFKMDRPTGDKIYYRWEGGKKTHIWTKVSHGAKEDIGDVLLTKIRKQLKLDAKKEVLAFVNCPLEYDGYISFLKTKGEL